MSVLQRIVNVRPAYDCIGVQPCVHGSENCKSGTGRSHGRHNAELHLTVRGEDAEVSLVIGTGWDLPTVPERHHRDRRYPDGVFVQTHTANPSYSGQHRLNPQPGGTCANWSSCYLNTGYSPADEPAALLVEKGLDAVWEWLENRYESVQFDIEFTRMEVEQ